MEDTVVWIYQMSSAQWDQASYRSSVAEGGHIAWPIGRKQTSRDPSPGDRIVCWWVTTGAAEFGVIGWGIIEGDAYGGGLVWNPRPPSDRWAMSPLISPELEDVVDQVRGGMNQATLYAAEGDIGRELLNAIRNADW
jgi:hypothetical protein